MNLQLRSGLDKDFDKLKITENESQKNTLLNFNRASLSSESAKSNSKYKSGKNANEF